MCFNFLQFCNYFESGRYSYFDSKESLLVAYTLIIFRLTVEDDVNVTSNRQRVKRSQSCVKTSRAPRPQSYIKNTGRKAKGSCNSRKFENGNKLI